MYSTFHIHVSHSVGFTAVFPNVFKNGSPLQPNNSWPFHCHFHIILYHLNKVRPSSPVSSWSPASWDAAVRLLPGQLPLPSASYQSSLESLATFGSLESLCWTTSLALLTLNSSSKDFQGSYSLLCDSTQALWRPQPCDRWGTCVAKHQGKSSPGSIESVKKYQQNFSLLLHFKTLKKIPNTYHRDFCTDGVCRCFFFSDK